LSKSANPKICLRCFVVNQEQSEQNVVDGIKKGADW